MDSIIYLRAPIFVWWNVTYACNLRCKQCYSSSGKPHPNELTTQEAKQLIRELGDMKIFYIYFLGGEPLLRKDIFELAEYARECGLETMMSTNGWFVNPAIAKHLEKVGFMHVRVSIDGACAETHDAIRGVKGSFSRAIRAVKFLEETNIPRIGVSPTVLNENVEEIPSLIELAIELGANEMQLVQLCKTGRGTQVKGANIEQLLKLRQVFEKYHEQLSGILNLSATEGISIEERLSDDNQSLPNFWGCPAGRTCLAIEAEGTIRPCILSNAPAGNIRQESFEKIWHESPLFKKMRTPSKECEGCLYIEVCSRECPIDSCVDNLYRQYFAKCFKKEVIRNDETKRKKGH